MGFCQAPPQNRPDTQCRPRVKVHICQITSASWVNKRTAASTILPKVSPGRPYDTTSSSGGTQFASCSLLITSLTQFLAVEASHLKTNNKWIPNLYPFYTICTNYYSIFVRVLDESLRLLRVPTRVRHHLTFATIPPPL
jgi:hypothetical protein